MSTDNTRTTSQRVIILNYLRSVRSHPSALEVFTEVRKFLPQISRGTVYRNLKFLAKRSKLLEIPGPVSRFDGQIFPHSHFVCRNCGGVFDVFNFSLNQRLPSLDFAKVDDCKVYFYGYCNSCQRKEDNGENN
ncbi:MAG: transcriptional repressor [Patescibacteria group bacterium]